LACGYCYLPAHCHLNKRSKHPPESDNPRRTKQMLTEYTLLTRTTSYVKNIAQSFVGVKKGPNYSATQYVHTEFRETYIVARSIKRHAKNLKDDNNRSLSSCPDDARQSHWTCNNTYFRSWNEQVWAIYFRVSAHCLRQWRGKGGGRSGRRPVPRASRRLACLIPVLAFYSYYVILVRLICAHLPEADKNEAGPENKGCSFIKFNACGYAVLQRSTA
jgi:hypothetical protein